MPVSRTSFVPNCRFHRDSPKSVKAMKATLTGSLHASLDITFYIYSVILLFLLRVIHDKLTIAGEAFGTDVEMLSLRVVIECD